MVMCIVFVFNFGTHAQQELQYWVMSIVCLFMTILALEAMSVISITLAQHQQQNILQLVALFLYIGGIKK